MYEIMSTLRFILQMPLFCIHNFDKDSNIKETSCYFEKEMD